jgi:hypothetical protein
VYASHRLANEKTLLNGHIASVFQFPQMDGKISLRGLQQVFQLIKFRNFALLSQICHDAEPESPMNHAVNLADIERGHVIQTPLFRCRKERPDEFSHESSRTRMNVHVNSSERLYVIVSTIYRPMYHHLLISLAHSLVCKTNVSVLTWPFKFSNLLRDLLGIRVPVRLPIFAFAWIGPAARNQTFAKIGAYI